MSDLIVVKVAAGENASMAPSAADVVSAALLAKLTKALSDLDALIGSGDDVPGPATLQAIKNQTKAAIAADPGPYIKALADSLITVARALKRDIRLDLALLDSSD